MDNNLAGHKMRVLKKKEDIQALDPESNDIYESGSLDYYRRRPPTPSYENLTFKEFIEVATYTHTKKNVPKSATNVVETKYRGKKTVYYYRSTPVIA